MGWAAGVVALTVGAFGMMAAAQAQQGQAGPPAVGVLEATKRPITESNEFLGRIEAVNRVAIVARVTAFLDKRLFAEGTEIKTGDLLYHLERGPFEADLKSKQAQVAQLQATLVNAKLTTDRARTLLSGPAGQQSTYDAALATQQRLEAQRQAGQLNFFNNTIDQGTDTILLRGTIPNPQLNAAVRELTDNEFVSVLLEGVQPVEVLAIPRAAVLSDQQGDYVFVLGADNKAEQPRLTLGQSSAT